MVNWKHWQNYTDGLSSPQNYIDWSFLYLISASLQRRVWCPPDHMPCFSNMYVILVGRPGIGKGLVIGRVSECLRYWKMSDVQLDTSKFTKQEDKILAEAIQAGDIKAATDNEFQGKSKGAETVKPLLIPIAADATTYEALVQAVSESYRRINYVKPDNTPGIYGHSSICFSLQELGSLMRKRTDDTVNYMLGLYDCPLDYEYITKTKGKDRVRRGCLNLLAGTTPSFMQSTFDEKLAGEGFTSRTFYVFANKNRKHQFRIPQLTESQKESQMIILQHILKLTRLYGCVKMDEETEAYLDAWWKEEESNPHKRINKSPQMMPYYARRNIHVMKVAMALHFSESTEMHIKLETFKAAIEFLDKEEKNMHLAITLETDNITAKIATKVMSMLETGRKTFVDLYPETFKIGKMKELEEALEFLSITNQIVMEQEQDEMQDKTITYYKLK